MNSNNPNKTLRQEIAEVIAAEKKVAAELAEQQRRAEDQSRMEQDLADTVRAEPIIATIREKVLAPDRANWKELMILTKSQVFVPDTHSDSDILLVDGAAKLVRDYCRDNEIMVRIVPERRDGQYSITSSTGRYIMSICVK